MSYQQYIDRTEDILKNMESALPQFSDASPPFYIVGSGSSFNQAMYLATILMERGIMAQAVYPNALCRYQLSAHSTVVLVSQSGCTQDILSAAEYAGKCRCIVFTADLASPLAQGRETYLFYPKDECILARSCGVVAGFYLALQFANSVLCHRHFPPVQVPQVSHLLIDQSLRLPPSRKTVFLACGILFAVAREAALKFVETGFLDSWAEESKNFAHGPLFPVLERRDTHIFLLSEAGADERLANLYREILGAALFTHVQSSFVGPTAAFDLLYSVLKMSLKLNTRESVPIDPPPHLAEVKKILNHC